MGWSGCCSKSSGKKKERWFFGVSERRMGEDSVGKLGEEGEAW